MLNFYPKAHENRVPISHPSVRSPRRSFLKAAASNFILLQLLFLALFSYIFGCLYLQISHYHNLRLLYVDYDGGVIGTSVREAYTALQGDAFPTMTERSPSDFPTPGNLETEVCKTRYWAALYTSPGASSRLAAALAGGSVAATYNTSDVLAYIWNEALYSTTVDSAISANIVTLSSTARVVYAAINGTGAIQTLNSTDPAAISAFADPWHLVSINIQPTTQGSRLIYNSLVIVLILIQEFFYLGTINGLYLTFKIYTRLYPHRIIIFRLCISLAYTFVGSLCVTGAIWAFRLGWHVNGNQFVLSWMSIWLFAHVNFLTLDVFTIWLPPPYVPMALITWVVLNVTSILIPFQLAPGFYHWAYVMPAHEVYQVLTDIWSRGCNPQLHYALPILFAMEISSLFLSSLGVYRRCHYAVLAEEAQEEAFRAKLDAAVAFERKKEREDMERERKEKEEASGGAEEGEVSASTAHEAEEREEEEEREELADVIREETNHDLRREPTGLSLRRTRTRPVDFGPCFDLAFGSHESDHP